MIVALVYLVCAVGCFVLLKSKGADWDLGKVDVIALAIIWPLFLLFWVDWAFGDLVDKLEDKIFRSKKAA